MKNTNKEKIMQELVELKVLRETVCSTANNLVVALQEDRLLLKETVDNLIFALNQTISQQDDLLKQDIFDQNDLPKTLKEASDMVNEWAKGQDAKQILEDFRTLTQKFMTIRGHEKAELIRDVAREDLAQVNEAVQQAFFDANTIRQDLQLYQSVNDIITGNDDLLDNEDLCDAIDDKFGKRISNVLGRGKLYFADATELEGEQQNFELEKNKSLSDVNGTANENESGNANSIDIDNVNSVGKSLAAMKPESAQVPSIATSARNNKQQHSADERDNQDNLDMRVKSGKVSSEKPLGNLTEQDTPIEAEVPAEELHFETPAWLPVDYDFGDILVESGNETFNKKKIVKKVEEDFYSWQFPKLVPVLVNCLLINGSVTFDFIYDYFCKRLRTDNHNLKVNLISTLEYLRHKGYIRSISSGKCKSCYICSPKQIVVSEELIKKNKKKDLSNFRSSHHSLPYSDAGAMEAISNFTLLAIANLLEKPVVESSDDWNSFNKVDMCGDGNAFIMYFEPKQNDILFSNDLVIAQFNTSSCTENTIEEKLHKLEIDKFNPARVIFASVNIEYADKLAKHFENSFVSKDGIERYVYSLDGNKEYSYPDHKECLLWNEDDEINAAHIQARQEAIQDFKNRIQRSQSDKNNVREEIASASQNNGDNSSLDNQVNKDTPNSKNDASNRFDADFAENTKDNFDRLEKLDDYSVDQHGREDAHLAKKHLDDGYGECPEAITLEKFSGNHTDDNFQEQNTVDASLNATPKNSSEGAAELAIANNIEDIMADSWEMIFNDRVYCATVYLSCFLETESVYKQLAYAVNDPMLECHYISDYFYNIFSSAYPISPYLQVSTALRIFFSASYNYDYGLENLYNNIISKLEIINNFSDLRTLLYDLMTFKVTYKSGIDACADYRRKSQNELNQKLKNVAREAISCAESLKQYSEEKSFTERYAIMKKMMFSDWEGNKSDIAEYLAIVSDNDTSMLETVEDFVRDSFIREKYDLDPNFKDNHKIDKFIDQYWDKAEGYVSRRDKNPLMGRSRTSTCNKINQVIDVLCQWLQLNSNKTDLQDDQAQNAYNGLKNKFLANIKNSIKALRTKDKTATVDNVGQKIITLTLRELSARIDGSYDEDTHWYFYLDFLRLDQVILNEDYLPDKTCYFNIKGLTFAERIRNHAKAELLTFAERMQDICDDTEDFGTADLICRYYKNKGDNGMHKFENFKDDISQAGRLAHSRFNDFIAELDYMDAFGQIDRFSAECNGDMMQSIAAKALEYADATNNYGYFVDILDKLKRFIKEEAGKIGSKLEETFNHHVDQYNNSKENNPELGHKLAKVKEAIVNQEYVIAEDILTRLDKDETEEYVNPFDKDYLEDFVRNYDTYYREADSKIKRNNRQRGAHFKEIRGGEKLANNWVNDNVFIDANQLKQLLQALEFDVRDVKKETPTKGAGIYSVKLNPSNSLRTKHCIAAFGSYAVEKDFCVITLNGNKDTDNLLELQRNSGSFKNTLVLLNYRLSLTERRKMACKVKAVASEKIFAVLDKVMVQYLINNYEKDNMNQMLMVLLIPFSYCQPYIWAAVNQMPPEIFIGRRNELQQIESPKGAQLVYGGRQLGKSALLRMAQQHIDHNANGDRAIYLDIKNRNYQETADYIGHALYDEGIFAEDKDSYSWDDLARKIKNRLKDEANEIPYFLLLLDEADAFIQSCQEVNYMPFDRLKDIQNDGNERFKFVVAGLHNIMRFDKQANSHNGVLTQLQHITIYPFKAAEGRELVQIPLYYAGIRFNKAGNKLIGLILATANYFPGLIQLYCANLLKSMTAHDYAGYNQNSTPPYNIQDKHIQKMLNEPEFKKQVQDKFEITLKLDEDNYYHAIALLLAQLYHEQVNRQEFCVSDIQKEATAYEVKKIADLSTDKLQGLMDELKELNILKYREDDVLGRVYSFNRYRFFQMMGSSQEIDDKLFKIMEGTANA